jgi:hypothetical protein
VNTFALASTASPVVGWTWSPCAANADVPGVAVLANASGGALASGVVGIATGVHLDVDETHVSASPLAGAVAAI